MSKNRDAARKLQKSPFDNQAANTGCAAAPGRLRPLASTGSHSETGDVIDDGVKAARLIFSTTLKASLGCAIMEAVVISFK
jgi:hypothetical protein